MSLAQGTLMTDELRPVEPVSLAEQLGNSPFSTPTRTRPKRGTSEDLLCRSPSYTPNFFGDELWPEAVSPEKENFVSPHNCKRHKVNIGHGKVCHQREVVRQLLVNVSGQCARSGKGSLLFRGDGCMPCRLQIKLEKMESTPDRMRNDSSPATSNSSSPSGRSPRRALRFTPSNPEVYELSCSLSLSQPLAY